MRRTSTSHPFIAFAAAKSPSMTADFPAPALCQLADEDLLIEMGDIIYPQFILRVPGANGLRLRVEGDYRDESVVKVAADRFQTLLGVLRAWRSVAGQRVDEVRPGIGAGSIRDEHGNQLVKVGSAIMYVTDGSEVSAYARDVKAALERSPHLRNALGSTVGAIATQRTFTWYTSTPKRISKDARRSLKRSA